MSDLIARAERLLRARPFVDLVLHYDAPDEIGDGQTSPPGFGARFVDMEDPLQAWLGDSIWKESLSEALAEAVDGAEGTVSAEASPPAETDAEADAHSSREDEALFLAWRNRVASLEDLEVGNGDGPRMTLIHEIHDDIAGRFPLGIARQLSEVLDCLACAGDHEDVEAVELLDDLVDTEQRSRALRRVP